MSQLSILMVDDSPILLNIQSNLVRRLQHQVTAVDSGQRALGLLRQQKFDLILMDMQMPVMDGVQATQAIRAKGITTPIFALTGNDSAEDKALCLQQGMNAVLTKPLKVAELAVLIQQYCR